jgi:uncharacterized protein YqeY
MKDFKDLKAARLVARKAKETVSAALLSTLLGEVQTAASRPDSSDNVDTVLVKVATKFKKNLEQTITKAGMTNERQLELDILSEFLPSIMTVEEITVLVTSLVDTHGKDMKTIMPLLKSVDGMDMKTVSGILRSL